MPHPQLISGWTVRASTPGPDVPLKALVVYPVEYKPVPARPDEPGLQIVRRGMLVLAAADVPSWLAVVSVAERGAEVVLRERSGRNHSIRLNWTYVPLDQPERYGPDGLAGLVSTVEGDLGVTWRAADLHTLDHLPG